MMKKLTWMIVLLMTLFFNFQKLYAQWIQTAGPEGGPVYCFAALDGEIFIGTNGGVFKSTFGGYGWTPVNDGLWNPVVFSLAVIDTHLFAGPPASLSKKSI